MFIAGSLVLAACSDGGETSGVVESVDSADVADSDQASAPPSAAAGPPIRLPVPLVPQVVLPDLSILGETGDLVTERLGDLIAPVNGVEVVAASCSEGGGQLVYTGSTGEDLFDIEQDGSGSYLLESDNGLVSLEVDADGAGRFYDRTGLALVSIEVRSDGSGQYYNEQGGGLVTVTRATDGTGEFYDDREGLFTVAILADGSGQFYQETEGQTVTVDARTDGSGQFYRERGDEVSTIDMAADRSWVFSQVTAEGRLEVRVDADGGGRYRRTGLDPLEFSFDQAGNDDQGVARLIPPVAPEFEVAARIPSLGRLGSLAPPCAAVIRFDDSLLFEFDEATIRPEAEPVMDEVATALIDADRPIEINGHTDASGTVEYNLDLSLRRAQAVEAALRARGLQVDIEVNGFGESEPVAPNETEDGADDPAGRALNRRVEIVIRE